MKSRTHLQEVRGLQFPFDILNIRVGDSVSYRIGSQETSGYSSLYNHDSRFFVLFIEEVNRESPQLFQGDRFEHRFLEPGLYSVLCLNYPKMRQTVAVAGEAEADRVAEEGLPTADSLSDISLMDSDVSSSTVRHESFFRHSESNSRFFSNQKDDCAPRLEFSRSVNGVCGNNINAISDCIDMISNGVTRERLADMYPGLLVSSQEENGSSIQPRRDSPRPNGHGHSDDNFATRKPTSYFDDTPYLHLKNTVRTENSLDVFGKISKVHRINQLNPDNLFQIFSRLKTELLAPSDPVISDSKSVFSSVEKLQIDVLSDVDLEAVEPVLPKGHKPRRLKRLTAQMNARFI